MRPAADRDLHRQSGPAGAGGLAIEEAHQSVRAEVLDRLNTCSDICCDMCTDRSSETAARVAAFLDSHHVLSLATVGPDGPHAVNLFYVRDEYALVWVSEPTSRHSIHLEWQPRVTATVAHETRLNQRGLTQSPIRSRRLISSTMKISTNGSRAPLRPGLRHDALIVYNCR